MTRAHSTAAVLFASAIAASGSLSAQAPDKPPAAQAVVQPAVQANAFRQLPLVRLYLAMAQDDTLVGGEAREFYAQLFAKGYRPELHLSMSGGHGFGMNVTRNTSDLFIDQFFRVDAGAGTHA